MAIKRSLTIQRIAKLTGKKFIYKINDKTIKKRMTESWKETNAGRIKNFQANKVELSELQQGILKDMNATGLGVVDVRKLVSPEALEKLENEVKQWAESQEVKDKEAQYRTEIEENKVTGANSGKNYETKRYDKVNRKTKITDPLIEFGIQPEILNVVNSYLGLHSCLHYVDNWKTIPNSGKAERKFSQNWHRDPEDAKLVKVFLYMKDIPAEAGPFEYILDTKNGNTYAHINPQDVPYGSYIDDAKLRKEIPAENFIAAAYPKYTLLFVDTTGIHRGGFAISDGRLLSHWTYVTMACPYVRFIIPEPDAKIQLNAAQKDLLFYK